MADTILRHIGGNHNGPRETTESLVPLTATNRAPKRGILSQWKAHSAAAPRNERSSESEIAMRSRGASISHAPGAIATTQGGPALRRFWWNPNVEPCSHGTGQLVCHRPLTIGPAGVRSDVTYCSVHFGVDRKRKRQRVRGKGRETEREIKENLSERLPTVVAQKLFKKHETYQTKKYEDNKKKLHWSVFDP